MRLFGLLVLELAFAVLARADLITLDISGTFDDSVNVGPLTAPDSPWSLTATIDRQPAGDVGGTAFGVQNVYDVGYFLNGSPIDTSIDQLAFGTAAGPFLSVNFADFSGDFDFGFASAFFSGTSVFPDECLCHDPTLLPGVYPVVFSGFQSFHNQILDSSQIGAGVLDVSAATPEPSSFLLTGGAFIAIGLGLRASRGRPEK